MHPSEVLACMSNDSLPDLLRARYTALLFLFVDDGSLPTKDDIGVKQTWLWKKDITKSYEASFSLDATDMDGASKKEGVAVIRTIILISYFVFLNLYFLRFSRLLRIYRAYKSATYFLLTL